MSTMRVLVFLLLSMSMSSLIHGTDSKESTPVLLGGGDIVGGYQPIKNLADPHIQDIAKFAVSKHNNDSHSNLIFKKIVSGKYQVVAGTNYVLRIEIKDGANLSIYEAKVYESLKGDLQLIYFKNQGDDHILGGYQPIKNLADPHIQDIAKFAVSKHKKDSQSNLIFQMIVVGEYQVVAGTNYVLLIEIKDAGANLSIYEAKVYESLKGDLQLIYFKNQGDDHILGGYQPIKNLTDPRVVHIAKFAVSKHNLIFKKIVAGASQVVRGINYVLVIEVKDGSRYQAGVFESLKGDLKLIYFEKLLEYIPGGYQPIKNLTDPHIQDIAKFVVSKHNLIFKKIVSGKYQVVAGINYDLVIEVKDGSRYQAGVFESLKGDLTLSFFRGPLEKKKKKPVVLSEWKPVENLEKDTHILEIARNAVLEHNKELAKDDDVLVFEKVVSGETQQVDHEGVKYRLVISANGAKFEALVWEKVTSFKPLP